MPPLFPPWAWGSGYKGSPLAHVNRRYHWHMGRLRGAECHCAVLREPARTQMRVMFAKEREQVTAEFKAWKEAYGRSRPKDPANAQA